MQGELIDQDELYKRLLKASTNVCFRQQDQVDHAREVLGDELQAGVITKEEFDEALDSLYEWFPQVERTERKPLVDLFKKWQ